MATHDVPGANPRNLDSLDMGCWAEDKTGESYVLVVGRESGRVIYQMYDLASGMFYPDAMIEYEFKKFFSVPPTGKSDVVWTWHDKTPFPWDQVMSRFKRPAPQHSDPLDQISAAARVAEALNLRGRKLSEADVSAAGDDARERGMAIIGKVAEAIGRAFGR